MSPLGAPPPTPGLRVLVVDDEPPALAELAWLLGNDPRVGSVRAAADALVALSELDHAPTDAVFLDIRIPGMDGMTLARVLAQFRTPPAVVFVTAYEEHAVEAFGLAAVDYLLKPVHPDRLAVAVDRVLATRTASAPADETIAVELGGVTRFVRRSQIRFAESHGDYARLHAEDGSHLVRIPLGVLEQRWRPAGFVRIHRRYLVSLAHVDEVGTTDGHGSVRVGATVLPVARRHLHDLREVLVERARLSR